MNRLAGRCLCRMYGRCVERCSMLGELPDAGGKRVSKYRDLV